MADVSLYRSVVGPFLDTLWFTVAVKIGSPTLRSVIARGLQGLEHHVDLILSRWDADPAGLTLATFCRAIYEILIVMQSSESMFVLTLLGVRCIFDEYLSLGYGFAPEVGFIQRFWSDPKPSLRHCFLSAFSSILAVASFHFAVPNLAPGPLGAMGPLIEGPSANHLLGLSFCAEFVAAFFFYSGFMVAIRCNNTRNRTFIKLILNLAGVYLVKNFTYDTLTSGVTRTPLRCWSAAVSSAFENSEPGIFFVNAAIHCLGLASAGWIFSPITLPSKQEHHVPAREIEERLPEPPIDSEIELKTMPASLRKRRTAQEVVTEEE